MLTSGPSSREPLVLLDSGSRGDFSASWLFHGHVTTLAAMESAEVPDLLARVEQAAEAGMYAAGFVSYEAASALNPDLPSLPSLDGLPLVWFALFRERRDAASEPREVKEARAVPTLSPMLSGEEHGAALKEILSRIATGESYQVNYTFPMAGEFRGDPLLLYSQVKNGQKASFSAYMDTGRHKVISASPELFFSIRDGVITTRPMKGTSHRGRWSEEDRKLAEELAQSPKERAENLMIVDLLRNDLGIIAETGSVTAGPLFAVESYPTLHQMTSTVSARLKAGTSLLEIFRALFPCGSVTGAPKRRSMEIIKELEKAPRGVYCGAIGCVAPGGEAAFSVAIRTLLLDTATSRLTLNVGSGITWGSKAQDEYRECLEKAAFTTTEDGQFVLIETMRLENGSICRLERHLARLAASASYFGFPFSRETAMTLLEEEIRGRSGTFRLRLTLDDAGKMELKLYPFEPDDTPVSLWLATIRIDPADRFRYHKTNRRELLDHERLKQSDCDEVLFTNTRGELTEGSYHNLVLRLSGRLITPRLESGLLPGILRQELLELGEISEGTLYPADLERAGEIWLINSLRGWRRAVMKESLT